MFSRAIDNMSPWTDSGMFDNVAGCLFRDGGNQDVTMFATLRSLLSRRLGEGVGFTAKVINHPDSADVIEDPVSSIDCALQSGYPYGVCVVEDLNNAIVVLQYRYTGMEDAASKLIEAVDKKFFDAHPGWETVDKSNAFLSQFMKVRILISKEKNVAILITERLTMSTWHLIQSVIPTFIPGLFKDIPVDQKEKVMLKSLTKRGSADYIRDISVLEDFYDIRGKKIESMVGGFEQRERQNQLMIIDHEIDRIRSQMEDLMRQYTDRVQKLDDANIRRNGMAYARDHADETGLVDFFKANKMLDVVQVSGSRISFVVRTAYENFDQDAYETFRDNDRFFNETSCGGVFSDIENRKLFMDAMFIDQKIKILLCAVYHLDIRGSVDTTCGYSFPANCSDYMANYHLDHHHCFGDYHRVITAYLERGDTIGAINACIASAKSININESGATFNPFMKLVFGSSKKCVMLPDGEHVTPAKALEWLKSQEGESKHEAD